MSKEITIENAYRSVGITMDQRLRTIESRIHDNLNRLTDTVIDIGRCLNQAKDEHLVPHGQWEAWVREHTQMTPQGAQRAMRAAREISEASPLAKMSFSRVMELLALPPAEREGFAEKVDAESLTVKELREAVKKQKAAEAEAEREKAGRLEAESNLRGQEALAAAERDRMRAEMGVLQEKLHQAEAGGKDKAQIAGLQQMLQIKEREIENQEAEIKRRAANEQKAKSDLLMLRTQVARGMIGTTGDGLTADELGAAAQSFMGRCAALPHMRAQLAAANHETRAAYMMYVDMLSKWCQQSMDALNTISGEVIDL